MLRKQKAQVLLPRWPLQSYSLTPVLLLFQSSPKRKDYICEILTSQPTAVFMFVGRKDGRHCSCIKYCGFSKIPFENHRPLPLMNTALEVLLQLYCLVRSVQCLQPSHRVIPLFSGSNSESSLNRALQAVRLPMLLLRHSSWLPWLEATAQTELQ